MHITRFHIMRLSIYGLHKSGEPATKRNRLRHLKSLGFIEIYRFLKIYNYEDLSRFLEVFRELREIYGDF